MTTLVQKVSKDELETRKLTDSKYLGLAVVPPEAEWFANILNANTRRAWWQNFLWGHGVLVATLRSNASACPIIRRL